MKIVNGLLILMVPSVLLAAGGEGHHPSVKDLFWPAVNFILIFGFLAYKLKKPVGETFTRNAIRVEEEYKDAGKLSMESEEKITSIESKLNAFETVKNTILNNMNQELEQFTDEAKEEKVRQIKRATENAKAKIQFEKNKLINQLNEELVDEVINSLKDKLNGNPELKKEITEKLIAGLK